MQFDELPDCLLLQIFKRCESKVDLWRARGVCKRWYQLLGDCELWRVCDLSEFELDDKIFLDRMLNYLPIKKCVFLEINKREIQMDAIEMFLQTAKQLQAMSLNNCKLNVREPTTVDGSDDDNDQTLCNNLKYLDLRRAIGDLSVFTKLFMKKGEMIHFLGKCNDVLYFKTMI